MAGLIAISDSSKGQEWAKVQFNGFLHRSSLRAGSRVDSTTDVEQLTLLLMNSGAVALRRNCKWLPAGEEHAGEKNNGANASFSRSRPVNLFRHREKDPGTVVI